MATALAVTGVPRGDRVRGFNPPPLNHHNIFWIVCLQNIMPKLCSSTHYILNFVQENVKNCMLISQFASASGVNHFCPQTSLIRDSRSQDKSSVWSTSVLDVEYNFSAIAERDRRQRCNACTGTDSMGRGSICPGAPSLLQMSGHRNTVNIEKQQQQQTKNWPNYIWPSWKHSPSKRLIVPVKPKKVEGHNSIFFRCFVPDMCHPQF